MRADFPLSAHEENHCSLAKFYEQTTIIWQCCGRLKTVRADFSRSAHDENLRSLAKSCKTSSVWASKIELAFGVLVSAEGGKPKNPEKNLRAEQGLKTKKTQPIYDAAFRIRTLVTLARGECSQHCATTALFYSDVKNVTTQFAWAVSYQLVMLYYFILPRVGNRSDVRENQYW